MSKWLNNKIVKWKHAVKPCRCSGFCPYGQLVEEFPLTETKRSCEVFGHDCPVFYHAEIFGETTGATEEEAKRFCKELVENVSKGKKEEK